MYSSLLPLYENASGQKVNGDKTALYFSHNTPQDRRASITNIFGTNPSTQFEKYLGLPSVIGRVKKKAFHELKDWIWKRLQGWKEKFLSQAGREVLIKAIIQAILTYAMSVFSFPAGLCVDICSMANRFWWGQREGSRKIHWLSKEKLIMPKAKGGIGFRDLHLFNKALLARQGWRLMQNPHSLVARLLKAKYFPHKDFLDASIPTNASHVWRSICGATVVLKAGLQWRIGMGSRVKIWKDAWLPSPTTHRVLSPICVLDQNAIVDSLIDVETMSWNQSLIQWVFWPRDSAMILAIPLSKRKPPDRLIWTGIKNGKFTVQSAYHLLLAQQRCGEASSSTTSSWNSLYKAIWSARVQLKVKLFIWRACSDILPTQSNLFRRGLSNAMSCRWCEDDVKTVSHALWQCDFAQKVWKAAPISFPSDCVSSLCFTDVVHCCVQSLAHPNLEIMLTTAWKLWQARNRFGKHNSLL